MSSSLSALVECGELYRRKTCRRCGATKFEKMVGVDFQDWMEEASFEVSGFGTVVITPYEMPYFDRREMELCVNCAVELDEILNQFMPKEKTN